VALILAVIILLINLGWSILKNIRSFDLLILTFTLVMPQLIAFPISLLGWNPLDYSQAGLIRTSIALIITVAIAISIGMFWKPVLWLKNVGIFYAIFTVLYTTLFTNGQGFFTGMVGSLGYWLSQQSVNRGTQPLYYYALVQIPMYEYLAALGNTNCSHPFQKCHPLHKFPWNSLWNGRYKLKELYELRRYCVVNNPHYPLTPHHRMFNH
jgi:hypothetical protein